MAGRGRCPDSHCMGAAKAVLGSIRGTTKGVVPTIPLLLSPESHMSAKRARSCFKPSLEGLGNRITPSHLKNIPALIPPVGGLGGSTAQLGNLVDIHIVIGSATGGAGSGKAELGPQISLFSNAHTATPQTLTQHSWNFGASRGLVTSGTNGSLSAVATLTTRSNDCGSPSASHAVSNPI
jgi:hypothetical protein